MVRWRIAVAAATLVIVSIAPSVSYAQVAGYLTALQGRVDVLGPKEVRAHPARKGQELHPGDIVRTKSDGRAEIVFSDNSRVTLAPNTRLAISQYVVEDGRRKNGVLYLFRGTIRSVVSKSRTILRVIFSHEPDFKVRTPTAVVGVKGTDFFVYHRHGSTGIAVAEGLVEAYNPAVSGEVAEISAGYSTTVDWNRPPRRPRHISKIELKRFLKHTKIIQAKLNHNEDLSKEKDDEQGGANGALTTPTDDDVEQIAGLDDLDDMDENGQDDSYDENSGTGGDDIDNDDILPVTETNPDTLNDDDDESGSTLFVKLKDAVVTGSFSAGGSITGQDKDELELYDPDTNPWGHWKAKTKGDFSGSTSDTWTMDAKYEDSTTTAHIYTKGDTWSGDTLSGKAFGYGADLGSGTTWISAGTTTGSFDPVAMTWEAVEEGEYLDTTTFLSMVSTPSGRQELANINIPFVEVGRANLSGSNGNVSVTMNDVVFFAYSTGAAPDIWATNSISGTFSTEPTAGTTVALSGNGLNADFTIDRWSGGNWTSTISNGTGTYSGSGTMDGTTVEFEGAGAGTYDSNSFSGTGSGVVK